MKNQDTTSAVSNNKFSDEGLLLPGLDGTNPLGFLAALGLLRTISYTLYKQIIKMKWESFAGTWVPRLVCEILSQEELLDTLEQGLLTNIEDHPAELFSLLNNDSDSERRTAIETRITAASIGERVIADWISAVASDIVPSTEINQLQIPRRDYIYRNLKSVIQKTQREHLSRSIFHLWDYADSIENQSLRLDPGEDRRHAYQWNKPSGDLDRKKSGGMLGANRLALEAIPLFISLPESDTLHTLGFTGNRSDNTRWTWPLWQYAIDLNTTISLLARPELQYETLTHANFQHVMKMGIVLVLRTYRILVGKTPNFTPAQRIA